MPLELNVCIPSMNGRWSKYKPSSPFRWTRWANKRIDKERPHLSLFYERTALVGLLVFLRIRDFSMVSWLFSFMLCLRVSLNLQAITDIAWFHHSSATCVLDKLGNELLYLDGLSAFFSFMFLWVSLTLHHRFMSSLSLVKIFKLFHTVNY